MVGSQSGDFASARPLRGSRLFSVRLPDRTWWGWEKRDEHGAVIARSGQLFMDYVSCFCDAERGNNAPPDLSP
jgi:hypothetical protein